MRRLIPTRSSARHPAGSHDQGPGQPRPLVADLGLDDLPPARTRRSAGEPMPAGTRPRTVFLIAGAIGAVYLAARTPALAGLVVPPAEAPPLVADQSAPAGPGPLAPGDPATGAAIAAPTGAAPTGTAAPGLGPRVVAAVDAMLADSGLMLRQIAVTGRVLTDRRDILEAVGVPQGGPMTAVNPETVRKALEDLPWVARARVERLLPDRLSIQLTEREPLALWQNEGAFSVIARDGRAVLVDPAAWAHLPLVVGQGADTQARAFLDLLDRFPAVKTPVVAATLVGGRRWTLHLYSLREGLRVLLPQDNVADALDRLVRLDAATGVLSRDLARIDLRLADRLVIEPRERPQAAAEPTTDHRAGSGQARTRTAAPPASEATAPTRQQGGGRDA